MSNKIKSIKNLENNIEVNQIEEWSDDFMKNSLKFGILSKIEDSIESIITEFRDEIEDMWCDEDYRGDNFPYKNKEEVLEFYDNEYCDSIDSEIIYQLKRNIKKMWNSIPQPDYSKIQTLK